MIMTRMELMMKVAICWTVPVVLLGGAWGGGEKRNGSPRYAPTWASLDSRPLPAWYDEAKLGVFLVWGVYSVPSVSSEWFWHSWRSNESDVVRFMEENYPADFTYADFASAFKAEMYEPDAWADMIEASGAKYIVLTTKHHDGFDLWPSKYSFNWNSGDVGPKRDLVGDLASAIRKKRDIHVGLYHSLFEWYHPLYLQDKANKFQTNKFVMSKTMPELFEIVKRYRPDVLWSDGEWEAPDWYWNSTEFLAWLYNDSPVKDTVVTNDRWGAGVECHHGGFLTCHDRYNPGVLQKRKWENAMTIDKKSWGYRRNAPLADYLTMDEIIQTFSETVSTGGNMLMNVAPTGDGRIVPIYEERLRQMGQWMDINGQAIYGSKPWTVCQNDTVTPNVWYTEGKDGLIYAIVNDWPNTPTLTLGCPRDVATVSLLGYSAQIDWEFSAQKGLRIDTTTIVASKLKSQWAWVFKLSFG